MPKESQPPADVDVSVEHPYSGQTRISVTAKRDGSNRGNPKQWVGEASSTEGAVKEVVKKIFSDRSSGEFIG
jgi:hypothetical protein